jgi:hypothetical protein
VHIGMNVKILIDGVVRQTMVLIAQLATSGGARAPLAHVAGQVFLELVRELEAQGVSRKVGADMFGLGLRSYQRKINRLGESATERGRSLWEAVYDHLQTRVTTRVEILTRFQRDDHELVRGVLRDLTESGLVFATGMGDAVAYRAATAAELSATRASVAASEDDALDAMLWAIVYREGPLAQDELGRRLPVSAAPLAAAIDRLAASGRVQRDARGLLQCRELVVPLGAPSGWEAAVLDHFGALVKTVCQKLRLEPGAEAGDTVGGSTYTFVVWPGHPLEAEVLGELASYRERASTLRKRVDAYNAAHEIPPRHLKVISYGGQCVMDEEEEMS